MDDFELNDLLKKEKDELDRIKIALDISQSQDKFKFEKNKFKTENVRFLTIALLTSVISLGSSYLIEVFRQENLVKTEKRNEFYKLVDSYHGADNTLKSKNFACEIADFRSSDKNLTPDIEKFDSICKLYSAIHNDDASISKIDTTSVAIKKDIDKMDMLEKELQKAKYQKISATSAEKEKFTLQIKTIGKKIDSISNNNPSIKTAVASSENIQQNVKKIQEVTNTINAQKETQATTKSALSWFKEGYFLQFGEYRLLLQYLDKNIGIQVQVCKTTSTAPCSAPIINMAWISVTAPLDFQDGSKKYRINLESIGHAGKNPFTLAAYVTFETLN